MKLLIPLFIVLIVQEGSAQIVLDNVYNGTMLHPACFSTGEKYIVKEDSLGILKRVYIYDLDHSLLKTISIVQPPPGQNIALYTLADDLFDTDSTTFEYLLNVYGGGSSYTTGKIYREDGTLLFTIDSVSSFFSASPATQEYAFLEIENDSGIFIQASRNSTKKVYVYKLPGKIHYCNSCCTSGYYVGNSSGIQKASPAIGNAMPNPLQHSTTIPYELPEGYSSAYIVIYDLNGTEMKRYLVGKAFNSIKVSSNDLTPGTYLYSLQTSDGKSDSKKMVVIK